MRRVGDDHGRVQDGGDHAPAHTNLSDLFRPALDDGRIAFRLLELLLQFLQTASPRNAPGCTALGRLCRAYG